MELLRVFTSLAAVSLVVGFSEPGLWKNTKFSQDTNYLVFRKSMYKTTDVYVTISCPENKDVHFTIKWILRFSPCAEEYVMFDEKSQFDHLAKIYLDDPQRQYMKFDYPEVEFIADTTHANCSKDGVHKVYLVDGIPPKMKKLNMTNVQLVTADKEGKKDNTETDTDENGGDDNEVPPPEDADETGDENNEGAGTSASQQPAKPGSAQRKKRADPAAGQKTDTKSTSTPAKTISTTTPAPAVTAKTEQHSAIVGRTWRSGYYVLILELKNLESDSEKPTVTVEMKGKTGYISAVDWPLLIFYGVMGLVYIIYGLVWIVLLACNWRDLMRLQYWIGAVIFLGMLEKAVFYTDFQSIANTGNPVSKSTIVVAEVVSCLKRALARMLIIIVSVGFGTVKPRLGPTFHKVLFVGGLYFILGSIEGCMRALKAKADQSNDQMLAAVPLAVLDASICWWIFSSLIQTTRQLRLRRNIVKLNLYRHFFNTLLFTVLAAIVFMLWSIFQVKMKNCIKFNELWVDEAFWHLLFSVILGIIMFLWRPSSNNQRYAFSPLIDASDDEDEEETNFNSDAFDVKTRKKQANGSPKTKQTTIEDDLKWVEENIPSTISDKAHTLIDDSDEEVDKYEVSKMQ
ncbi:transmembrane protein 87A-like [Mya arenaria]|uniref:transmembrane protein 87A-like n=1 Tax=Mya arenaria TaxID=6604 RepID=UPI0022E230D1|nr:transmembrane protein 87A-like [Mya arenaria]XP_052769715.1 transmembrane protein 87A-like [Mya arenaria]